MANWDFCSACNSGEHCCRHDACNCSTPGLTDYSATQLRAALKEVRAREKQDAEATKKARAIARKKRIAELKAELKKLEKEGK